MQRRRSSGDGNFVSRYPQKLLEKPTPQKWVQCTFCKQWRQVPYHLKDSDLGDRWECSENIWDPMYASCAVRQALSDEQIDAILESCQEIEEQGEHHRLHEVREQEREEAKPQKEGMELSDVVEGMLKLGGDGEDVRMEELSSNTTSNLVPGRVIWGKVEGHDWWPAKVVRRRSVPAEVGPPPGGASEVMCYTPVVFFTPNGIPKEVDLSMDSPQFPIVICQRACGRIDEEEAEYAWLSADNIRLFCHGDTSGKKDGSLVDDEHLQRCIAAAQNDLNGSETQTANWKDDEDSDGGWCCAAEFHRNRSHKHKKANRKKNKRPEDGGTDGESGEEGPELVPVESFRLAPKIAVEVIHAWRRPLGREKKAKEMEYENAENALNLKKLAYLEELLRKKEPLGPNVFDGFVHESSTPRSVPSRSLDDADLMEQEREAVSTLLGLVPLSLIDGEAILPSLEEAEYFVKYANRSHLHNEWVKESTLMAFAKRKLTQFKRRHCNEPIDMFNKEWAKPEKMISRRKSRTGPGWELLIKWKALGYEDCTWESEGPRILNNPEAVLLFIDLWRRQNNAVRKKTKSAQALFQETRKQQFANYKPIDGHPEWLKGGALHQHQLDALNWLRSTWLQDKGGILIGGLGQGRTATVAAFLQCLKQEMNCVHPFLIAVPVGQLSKWDGEIQFWSEGRINTVQYHGCSSARPICLDHEIWQSMECMDGRYPCREMMKIPKPDAVLVSSDVLQLEMENLLEVPWDVAILDTRWVAKGGTARLATALMQMKCPHFVVACDLPATEIGLANTLRLIDSRHASLMEGRDIAEEGDKEERMVEQLQGLIRKHVFEMRSPVRPFPRQKYKEIFVPLEFKQDQRDQYKDSLVKYYDVLKDEGLHRFSMQNVGALKHICEELCMICQHPVLSDDNEDFDAVDLTHMIGQSGKFEALDVLLHELQEASVHSIILTQTDKTLGLLFKFVKDRFGQGSVECLSPSYATVVRHASLNRFLEGKASFLLATGSSCGLGMKLQKVTCVVVVESAMRSDDDLVALSRAYQLGNIDRLPVFRLFMGGTVEERMLRVVKKSDLQTSIKGNSHDMKLFEDVLIWGTRGLFDDAESTPFAQSIDQRSPACTFNGSICKALLRTVFDGQMEGNEGDFGVELSSIKWSIRSKQDIHQETETVEYSEAMRHMNDPLVIARYWEQLLGREWNERRRQDDAKDSAKRERLDVMEFEMEKDRSDRDDHGDPIDKEQSKRRLHHRKRLAHDPELPGTSLHQKKQKSAQKSDLPLIIDDAVNDENKWTREALLSCKAHQDVLSQILADPNTIEGKATREAFIRIEAISKELSLPVNIVMMARQVAEILMTMKEEQDAGSYFHDYTLLVVIAFAAYLGGFNLGEGCGLKALATKYNQDLETMEKLFNYVTKLMLEYKQMLVKVNQILKNKDSPEEEKAVAGEGTTSQTETMHSAPRDLDNFLLKLSESCRKDKDVDMDQLMREALNAQGGFKGHVAFPWYTFPAASDTTAPRRPYDVDKQHDPKHPSIDKPFSFEDNVRDLNLVFDAVPRPEDHQRQLKHDLGQRLDAPPAAGYNALLAQMHKVQWPHSEDQITTPTSQRMPQNKTGPMTFPTGASTDRRTFYVPSRQTKNQDMWMAYVNRLQKPQEKDSERKGTKSSTVQRTMYPAPSHPPLGNKQRSTVHGMLPTDSFPRASTQDIPLVQQPPRLQAMPIGQHPIYVSAWQQGTSPMHLPVSYSILSTVLPNVTTFLQPPRVAAAVPSLPVQQTEILQSLPSHLAWSTVPPIRPVTMLESLPMMQGRCKTPAILEMPPVRVEAAQPAKVVLSASSATLSFSDWLPSAESVNGPSKQPIIPDIVQNVRLERSGSLPEATATITTGTGKPPPPQLVRHSSGPEFHIRTPFAGVTEVPQRLPLPLPEARQAMEGAIDLQSTIQNFHRQLTNLQMSYSFPALPSMDPSSMMDIDPGTRDGRFPSIPEISILNDPMVSTDDALLHSIVRGSMSADIVCSELLAAVAPAVESLQLNASTRIRNETDHGTKTDEGHHQGGIQQEEPEPRTDPSSQSMS